TTATPRFWHSLVGGADSWSAAWGSSEEGNIASTTDPFMDSGNGDFTLTEGSEAIDAGGNQWLWEMLRGSPTEATPTDHADSRWGRDLAGNHRFIGDFVDMGGFEALLTTITPDANNIVYVNQNVNQHTAIYSGDGSDWSHAIPELADVLHWAKRRHDSGTASWYADNPLKIYVATGTYRPRCR